MIHMIVIQLLILSFIFSVKPAILLKNIDRVDRRELLAAQKKYQEDLDRFVDHCL